MAWDDPSAGDGTLTASEYDDLVDAIKNQDHMGEFLVTGTGTQAITGVGFQPSQIMFWCESVGGQNVDGVGTQNGDGADNYQGTSIGFARDDGTRQVIHSGGSGNSINSVSKFSSDTGEVVALRYGGNNGQIPPGGVFEVEMSSWDEDGFTVNVTDFNQNEVVIYWAKRF